MVERASAPTVAAVVAAHDEAERIDRVLGTLASYPGFDEVVVVDDGSTDATAEVVARYPVTCVRLGTNQGKGAAMEAGVRHAGTDVLFFADADIRDLDHAMIDTMLAPVVAGDVDMFVAMRHRSIYHLRSALRFLPLLGGERAVSAKLWHAVPDRYRQRFKIEAALNFYAVHHGRGLRYRVFPISQTLKESKYGLVPGLVRRARMTANVGAAIAEVQVGEAPPDARARRRAAVVAATATAALVRSVRRLPRATSAESWPGPSRAPTLRQVGAATTAAAAGLVVVSQLVRLAQSHARADG